VQQPGRYAQCPAQKAEPILCYRMSQCCFLCAAFEPLFRWPCFDAINLWPTARQHTGSRERNHTDQSLCSNRSSLFVVWEPALARLALPAFKLLFSHMILRTIWAPVSVNVQNHNLRHQRQSTTAADFSLVLLTLPAQTILP